MAQTMSRRGLMELIGHEGIVASPYYDSANVLTWGVGHTAHAGEPLPSTKWGKSADLVEVFSTFRRDVARYEAQVRLAFTRPLTQEQFDAAVSFHFNTGAIARATWVKKFNAGDIAGSRKSFMDWRKPAEIVPRRTKERDLFFAGKYGNGGKATLYPADDKGRVLWGQGKVIDLADALARMAPPAPPATPIPANPLPPRTDDPAGKAAPSNMRGWLGILILALSAIGAGIAVAWDWLSAFIERIF